jgi:hypothetical protein
MFENSLQAQPEGTPWSVIAGLAVFVVLIMLGSVLVGG